MTREEAIEILSRPKSMRGAPAEILTAHTMAIKALEQTTWIPCSERLPEENGQYLITVKYKPEADYENIYAEHGEWTDGRWDMFCFGHCGEVEDIIAWMPLPEPYEPTN